MPAGGSSRTRSSTTYDDPTPMKVFDNEKLGSSTSDAILPTPIVQIKTSSPAQSRRNRRLRFQNSTTGLIQSGWERLLRKFGAGTAPSASSVDLESEGVGEANEIYGSWWGSSQKAQALEDADEIDEVVVDREWGDEMRSSSASDHGGDKWGDSRPVSGGGVLSLAVITDADSMVGLSSQSHTGSHGFWSLSTLFIFLRWQFWPVVRRFFITQFVDEKSEELYRKESWFIRKNVALWCAAFYIVNWVISLIFVPKPILLSDKIFHFGIAPAFTLPIFFMVLYDFPRDRRFIYQVVLTISTWMWSFYLVVVMYMCAYYGHHKPIFSCGTKDFLATFYYANGPPVIALFGLDMKRFPALIATVSFMSICWGLIVPSRTTWSRNVINFMFFHLFLLYIHYQRENAERRLYTLRDQLKVQFRATQKAQINERKAADSKRRLTSYVFHEVRVPLNTALLAVQNMSASGCVDKSQDIEFNALEGSLSMMSKVLNDVLDFNRMDSGRFESVLRPYSFHQVMKSLLVPLKLATDARGLSLVTELDKSIDDVARKALYEAIGHSEAEIAEKMSLDVDEDGIVVGDESRLRQIITNLASNACKFTPAGGQLVITTKLILPNRSTSYRSDSETLTNGTAHFEQVKFSQDAADSVGPDIKVPVLPEISVSDHVQLSSNHLAHHDSMHSKVLPLEWIVVRIEVKDTGSGIRPKDMVQCKLFSAFNQTDLGRQQGGKGTGLGLALVRQIVKLSGGRLGVQSKLGAGSTFWVEIPLGVGAKATSYLNNPQFFPQPDAVPGTTSEFNHMLKAPTLIASTAMSTMSHRAKLSRTKSAMHTIMDQGGMVEISTKPGEDECHVLTRTIGDPSTGTDPTPSLPLTTPESSPIVSSAHPHFTASPEATIRPSFVQLPARQPFVLEEQLSEAAVSDIHTPSGSVDSSIPSWEPGLRVLVVDDDPLTRKLMARMLSRLGCKVSTAENGNIALELILGGNARPTPSSEDHGSGGLSIEAFTTVTSGPADEFKYAVVFLDNQMPVMSGLDTVARLRELGRKDFVVGVTGNALLDDQQEYYAAGVDHVLTKPVQEKCLKAMLTTADERRRNRMSSSEPFEPPDSHPPSS